MITKTLFVYSYLLPPLLFLRTKINPGLQKKKLNMCDVLRANTVSKTNTNVNINNNNALPFVCDFIFKRTK